MDGREPIRLDPLGRELDQGHLHVQTRRQGVRTKGRVQEDFAGMERRGTGRRWGLEGGLGAREGGLHQGTQGGEVRVPYEVLIGCESVVVARRFETVQITSLCPRSSTGHWSDQFSKSFLVLVTELRFPETSSEYIDHIQHHPRPSRLITSPPSFPSLVSSA